MRAFIQIVLLEVLLLCMIPLNVRGGGRVSPAVRSEGRFNPLFSRKAAVSTNVTGYLALLTLNAEASYSIGQHFTLNAGTRYNPFEFKLKGMDYAARYKQFSVSAGTRYWPWHVYSGWWLAGKAQYQVYNAGGISSLETREGDRFGGGLSGGYSYMLGTHFNLEIGVGIWGGWDKYRIYTCPRCGITKDTGSKLFILPDDIILGLSYVF